MDLHLEILPQSSDGVIFWSGQPLEDFLGLGLSEGVLQLRYDLGGGEALLSYDAFELFDGNWHSIRVLRKGHEYLKDKDRTLKISQGANRIVLLKSMTSERSTNSLCGKAAGSEIQRKDHRDQRDDLQFLGDLLRKWHNHV
ncbi:basement membrane proteoglycan [Plakobranchus ocellatus]|uniref:Basement membrane proteoglycan n=1 Tax=Plakobranchus ocellatus TaxID=259542 RepID=A0AAV4DTP2_9GAST|nr:basement membrane proteoglycan [Plakobranchus ocellatus]